MILVTGATGFIGSHLVSRLALSSKVRCLIRPTATDKARFTGSVELVVEDLARPTNLEQALEGVDCVIHLAALLRKEPPDQIRRVNIEGTRRLVDTSIKKRVGRFIFLSSENALREDLHDAYAESKRAAEAVVRSFPNYLILRPCFVYGLGDDHGLGRLVHMGNHSCFVPLFGNLKSLIQPIYIDDMIEYLSRAVHNGLCGEYMIAGSDTINLNEFVKKALRIAHKKKVAVIMPHSFYYAAAVLGDILFKGKGWGRTQLKNIYSSRTYSIEKTVKDFDYAPRGVNAGLTAWLGARNDS